MKKRKIRGDRGGTHVVPGYSKAKLLKIAKDKIVPYGWIGQYLIGQAKNLRHGHVIKLEFANKSKYMQYHHSARKLKSDGKLPPSIHVISRGHRKNNSAVRSFMLNVSNWGG